MVELVVLVFVLIVSVCIIHLTLDNLRPRKNRKHERSIREMLKVFDLASEHIDIVTDLPPPFFGDPRLLESFEKAAERGVRIRVVWDPNGYTLDESRGLQKLAEAGLVKVARAKRAFTKEKDRHVMEVDGMWARLETYHPAKRVLETGAQARIFRSPVVAQLARQEFERHWKQSIGHSDDTCRD